MICSDLQLQLLPVVEQGFIVPTLLLNVPTDVWELSLQLSDNRAQILELNVMPVFSIFEGILQASFLQESYIVQWIEYCCALWFLHHTLRRLSYQSSNRLSLGLQTLNLAPGIIAFCLQTLKLLFFSTQLTVHTLSLLYNHTEGFSSYDRDNACHYRKINPNKVMGTPTWSWMKYSFELKWSVTLLNKVLYAIFIITLTEVNENFIVTMNIYE